MKPTKVPIADIIILEDRLYPRNGVSTYNIIRLAQALEAGASIPPVVIEAGTNRLVDGRHRLEAVKRRKGKTIDAIVKTYKDEAELFADAVRLNVSHGVHLDQFSVRSAILRLMEYGFSREIISDIIRVPVSGIEKIERRGFATGAGGEPIPLKGGLDHLRGERLDPEQQKFNRHYSGGKATFYINQLCAMIANDLWPRTDAFAAAMDRLFDVWMAKSGGHRKKKGAA